MTIEKFDVLNRWTGKVAFPAEIEVKDGMTRGWKLRLAVAWAIANSVHCHSLDLSGADFSGYHCPDGSSFDGSSFDGSRFVDSIFDGSIFDGSSFVRSSFVDSSFVDSSFVRSSFDGEDEAKEDFMRIMAWAEAEIPAVICALKEGRVNGSVYAGECSCLVGTIATARGVDVNMLEQNGDRPAERWFMMISTGDKPGDQSPGGYASARAVEWAEEYAASHGIAIPA